MAGGLLFADEASFSSSSKTIVNEVTLKIEKGITMSFVGKSGSGKSTLLKMMAGILVPSSGRVFYKNKDIQLMSDAENKKFRRDAAFVFQDSALWENQDIYHNLNLPLQTHCPSYRHEERQYLINDICKKVQYLRSLNARPADLSMGEQKKIAFARAMITKPEILFLDEVTESLDHNGVQVIMDLIHKFVEDGGTLIYINHNSFFLNEFPGITCIIEEGKLVSSEDGTWDDKDLKGILDDEKNEPPLFVENVPLQFESESQNELQNFEEPSNFFNDFNDETNFADDAFFENEPKADEEIFEQKNSAPQIAAQSAENAFQFEEDFLEIDDGAKGDDFLPPATNIHKKSKMQKMDLLENQGTFFSVKISDGKTSKKR